MSEQAPGQQQWLDAPPPVIPPELTARIVALRHLPLAELRALWAETFDRPPAIANRRFMERRIAYHWQCAVYEAANPGVLAQQRQRIQELIAIWEASQAVKPKRGATTLAPGTVLIRGYMGTDHEVRVAAANEFEYAGKRYKSLSEVARVITGARWSGPAFFGLPQQKRGSRR